MVTPFFFDLMSKQNVEKTTNDCKNTEKNDRKPSQRYGFSCGHASMQACGHVGMRAYIKESAEGKTV
jgi:hypothetical protein